MRAYRRGAQDYIDGTRSEVADPPFLAYLSALTTESPEILVNSPPAGFPDDLRVEMAALERDLGLLMRAGICPTDVPASDLVDLSFVPDPQATA